MIQPAGIAGNLENDRFHGHPKRPVTLGVAFIFHRHPMTVESGHLQAGDRQGKGQKCKQYQGANHRTALQHRRDNTVLTANHLTPASAEIHVQHVALGARNQSLTHTGLLAKLHACCNARE